MLPQELILCVLEYLPDIDIRRAFQIYRPISPQHPAKKTLAMYIRAPIHIETYYRFYFVRFLLPNQYPLLNREIQNIEDDHLDFELWTGANDYSYDVCIHRLVKKEEDTNVEDIYYKGDLTDYYWKTVNIPYDSDLVGL